MNPLLWTPTRGEDCTKALFPLTGESVWPEVTLACTLVALVIVMVFSA